MACLVRVGILTVAIVGWSALSGLQAATPAWESGGRPYEVSDLPSVVVAPEALPLNGQPPLPPEPELAGDLAEDRGILAPAEVPEGVVVEDAQVPALADRLQEFIPSPPGLMTFDSAAAIEPDGTVVPASKWPTPTDWLNSCGDACWVARFEALALWRSAPANRPLYTTFNIDTQTAGPTVFNANQFQSDPVAAPRLTIARIDECGRGFEASYLYAGTFYSDRSLPLVSNGYAFAAPGIYNNNWGPDNTPISAAQQQLTSSLQTAEINFREPLGWGATRFLAGFRWFQWRENWQMVDQFEDPTDPTVTGTDNWRTNSMNNLFGGQIGLESVLWNRGQGGVRLESLVKAGAYYNAANQSSAYDYQSSQGGVPIFGFSRAVTVNGPAGAAFSGEVGLTGVMPLRRNLDLRVGYFGLWLQGLAQPTRQLSGQTLNQFDPPSGTLTTNGGVVLQGVSLGLEGRW
jgi:hypothetical protein